MEVFFCILLTPGGTWAYIWGPEDALDTILNTPPHPPPTTEFAQQILYLRDVVFENCALEKPSLPAKNENNDGYKLPVQAGIHQMVYFNNKATIPNGL